jgi:large subunit ribosomal protein L25
VEVTLTAEVREGTGKGVARKLRAAGKVPATLYGAGGESQTIAVDARALGHALHTEAGRNVLIDLQVNGETTLTLARDVQRDPLRGAFIHVDFMRINRNQAIHVDVPIHIEGESPGVKEGGVIEHHLWNVSVECLPGAVPDRIIADVSAMAIGATLHVGDLIAVEGVTVLTDPEEIVLGVVVPQKPEEAVPVPVEGVPVEGEVAEGETAEAPEGGE